MKTKEEIEDKIKELESDERLSPSATIIENAPLVLIQVEPEAKIYILKWILTD